MLAFIIDKRKFKEFEKKPEIVFIFNNEKLFDELSLNYKCVNLNSNGKITKENFFPKRGIKSKYIYFEIKRGVYAYFKKKHHKLLSRKFVMRSGYKDSIYYLVINQAKELEKKAQYEEANILLDRAIINTIKEILDLEEIKFDKYAYYVINYTYSFYRAYIYSFIRKRGIDVLGDIFRFNLALNILRFYKYNRFDVLNSGFKYGYLRVISRLFIEQMHKNNVKDFVNRNIEFYKSNDFY